MYRFHVVDLLSGNFVAVATMHPEIEIWDLDVVSIVLEFCEA